MHAYYTIYPVVVELYQNQKEWMNGKKTSTLT